MDPVKAEVALPHIVDRGSLTFTSPLVAYLVRMRTLVRLKFGGVFGVEVSEVECAGPVWTGSHTIAAADTLLVVHDGDPIGSLPGGVYGTDLGAGGILTLHAGTGGEPPADVGIRPHFLLHYDDVDHTWRDDIFRSAGHGAGVASDTLSLVHHHDPVSFPYRLFQCSVKV
jgi:hypothetical protein